MTDKPPPPASGSAPSDPERASRLTDDLVSALKREAAEAEAAAAGTVREGGGEARLKLDKSGALIGVEKLRPVKAHPRPEGEAPAPSAPAAQPSATAAPTSAAPARAPEAPAAPGAPRRAALPPRIGAYVPPGFPGGEAEASEVAIATGTFLFGELAQPQHVSAFAIDRLPVTHGEYERFVRETGHRPPLYWPAGHMPEDLREHPVVGVDYFDALAYARWLGKDLPYEDEWERAARGTDGRAWPWGDAGDLPHSNTARAGLKMTLPVGFHAENESPDGVRDMVGNVWQITHSPAPGGGVVVRGGSWFDFAFHAKTWFRFAARPTARNGTIGFRCVRRLAPRLDAPREIDPAVVEAEIASRRGPQAPTDVSQFSADRRDLVPDYRRLRVLLAEKQMAETLGAATPPRSTAAASAQAAAPVPAPEPRRAPHPLNPPPAAARPTPPPAPAPTPPHVPAPPPPRVPTPAPTPPQAPEAPLHVLLQTGSAAGAAAAAAAAAPAPVPPVEAAPPPPPSLEQMATQRTPRALWVLLALGFALLAGLLAWLLNSGPRGATTPTNEPPEVVTPPSVTPEPAAEPSGLPPEPAAGAAALDGQPPRLLDGASGTWPDRLGHGAWLLVFAGGPDAEAAALTRRCALSLHRRFHDHGLNVALVVPRAVLQSGTALLDAAGLEAALASLGARDGLTVLLDPRQDGRDAIREVRHGLGSPNAALLLEDGVVSVKTQPPEGGMSLTQLQRIAERARSLVR